MVVVVEAGTGAGSVTVVVRLTVVVVSVGGGVLTTSSLAQAPRQAAAPIIKMRRDNVFIFAKSKLRRGHGRRIYILVGSFVCPVPTSRFVSGFSIGLGLVDEPRIGPRKFVPNKLENANHLRPAKS